MTSELAKQYLNACKHSHVESVPEFLQALNDGAREVIISQKDVPLHDADLLCMATALEMDHPIMILNLEENSFGLQGTRAIIEAMEKNPDKIRELRLGKNQLKDQSAVAIGHTLSRTACGLKVLDLSENGITKLGVIPLSTAIQSEACTLVEISFHNNRIEGDAAIYLGEAITKSTKLRHLHLGYNMLRDTGALSLSRFIPSALSLSTLDLTANRIGSEGGKGLALALMDPNCKLQRLNLRHNLFDSETIELFGSVLRKNKSLIQLFLGYMSPTPETAASVLSALEENSTLLLLDIFGWKVDPSKTSDIFSSLLARNNTIAAIVTDSCEKLTSHIASINQQRESNSLHPIYIGADDREAYMATRSLKQFSRAQSRRLSRASSVRSGSNKRTTSQTPIRSTSSRVDRTTNSDRRGRSHSQSNLNSTTAEELFQQYKEATTEEERAKATYHLLRRMHHEREEERRNQARLYKSLEARVEALERRRECTCGALPNDKSFDRLKEQTRALQNNSSYPTNYATPPPTTNNSNIANNSGLGGISGPGRRKEFDVPRTTEVTPRPAVFNRNTPLNANAIQDSMNHPNFNSTSWAPSSAISPVSCTSGSAAQAAKYHPNADINNISDINWNAKGQPSNWRDVYDSREKDANRSHTPLAYPSENPSERPEPAEPNDEPGDLKPAEVSLQRSRSQHPYYPPHIDASPMQDTNPPRRKSVSRRPISQF